MKHNVKITTILVIMFLVTQLIGIAIVGFYNNPDNILPYGMEPPAELQEKPQGFSILFAFVLAIGLFFLLTKINADKLIRIWFFIVTIIALALSLNAIITKTNILFFNSYLSYIALIAVIIGIPLAYIKIFKRNVLIHNLTELLIYPGIAAVFVPILNIIWIVILLFLISLYDIWAVWYTEFMQKMAHYQMNNLKIFTGFFIPYAGKKQKEKIKLLKQRYKNKSEKEMERAFRKEKIKVNLAILGGGDVIFPIIAAGIFYKVFNSVVPALIIASFSTIALLILFVLARKGKFYPAMPFLTIGIYLGMIVSWFLL